MADARRIEKIQVLGREILAEIIARELQFPDGALVTVTRLEVSPDLYYARAFVSVLSREPAAEKIVLDELARSIGVIQREFNRRLRMRPVPKITFEIDREEKRRERIEKLLSDTE
ncbi:MAG: 30S ribosome-binding factor RbfA [Candidatus Sungbacteria bacterium]|uniref:Ribosome-binding factor A n=1 Tax=Candidatus Sungiibacteriota bacterium TaxID=2750080 RepID=A0A933DTD7_9BACT|nr:30S ribosome-binding factor RbfA [Candidatus Sungbacteria bacterium]